MALYAFDGTWNDSRSPDRDTKGDTNVHRFCELYSEKTHYLDGVGSRWGIVGKLIGGATGAGAAKRVEEQFANLQKAFKTGDEVIDIVGYSRGATIARLFVHRIEEMFDQIQRADQSALEVTRSPRSASRGATTMISAKTFRNSWSILFTPWHSTRLGRPSGSNDAWGIGPRSLKSGSVERMATSAVTVLTTTEKTKNIPTENGPSSL